MTDAIKNLEKELENKNRVIEVLRIENEVLGRILRQIEDARKQPRCFVCGFHEHVELCPFRELHAIKAKHGIVYGLEKKTNG